MAQAVNVPNNQQQNNVNNDHLWPLPLILNQAYAKAFACVKCNGLPKRCMTDVEGDIICDKCAKNMNNMNEGKAVQKLVNRLKAKCFSRTMQQKNDDETEGTNVIATQILDDECDWTGTIKEYDNHQKECLFIVVECDKCKSFKCKRKLLNKHFDECGEVTINCPLSCGLKILRKNTTIHLENNCAEQLLDCTNDDCKLQIKRKDFDKHTKEECDTRIVICEYKQYGCNAMNIKANQLKHHMNEYKFEHLSNKFDFSMKQVQLNMKQVQSNMKQVHIANMKQVQKKLDDVQKQTVPIGTIVMWSGSKDNIPNGWCLCNGNNNTPDLRNRFIIGATDEYKVNSNGGNTNHNHNITVNGHALTVDQIPSHSHKPQYSMWRYDVDGNWCICDDRSTKSVLSSAESRSKPTGGNQAHNHTATSSTTTHLPPYYALCFIIKKQND